jgi:hypothetical protein
MTNVLREIAEEELEGVWMQFRSECPRLVNHHVEIVFGEDYEGAEVSFQAPIVPNPGYVQIKLSAFVPEMCSHRRVSSCPVIHVTEAYTPVLPMVLKEAFDNINKTAFRPDLALM